VDMVPVMLITVVVAILEQTTTAAAAVVEMARSPRASEESADSSKYVALIVLCVLRHDYFADSHEFEVASSGCSGTTA
jgi:hypothetical protein